MKKTISILCLSLCVLLTTSCAKNKKWVNDSLDSLQKTVGIKKEPGAGLDTATVVAGLKEALGVSVNTAVDKLGKEIGYALDPNVKIPLPEHLQTTAKVLSDLGQQKVVDEFTLSLNRAAEKAVPEAQALFVDLLKKMTVQDAMKILRGGENAATLYFRDRSEVPLIIKFRPAVSQMTQRVGVTSRYKKLVAKAGALKAIGIDMQQFDLDGYITRQALSGVYFMMAEEEKRIRQDPVARTTELLRKVFE